MKPGTVAVAVIAIALVVGGLFFGLGGLSGSEPAADSVPRATRPPSTVPPPAPAVVEPESESAPPASAGSIPADSAAPPAESSSDDGDTLPVPNVIGVSRATAEARLTDFVVEVTSVDATDADFLDAVSEQSPEAAERLPAGGTVSITVSVQPVPETTPADPVPVGEFTSVDLDGLEDGDCANGTLVDLVFVYERVECDVFHDVQLIRRFDVEDGPDEFDRLALDELIREQCLDIFEEFVGVSRSDSSLSLRTVRPNDVRYDSEGERTSMCLVGAQSDARVLGSAEDSLW